MPNRSDESDQSASMGRSDDDQNEADTSFLDDDFLSFAAENNGGGHSSSNNSKKRSRSISPTGGGTSSSVPWMMNGSGSYSRSPHHRGRGYNSYYHETPALIKLHNEMVSFVKLMEPTREELEVRDQMVERVTDLAKRTFGKRCKVLPFGSQVTGLCLPNSDIDFVIRFDKKSKRNGKSKSDAIELDKEEDNDEDNPTSNPLHTFADAIREEFGVLSELQPESTEEHLSYLEVIEQTRVPLVKFTVEPYGIDMDVCFDQPGGPESAELMHKLMSSMPPLRPLTFVLKYFLASRDINKPFTGGIGSYMLQLMIVSFLQHRSRDEHRRGKRVEPLFNLGSLLMDFLEFYGNDFNYYTTAISVRNDGYYFAKGERDKKDVFWQPSRPFSLAIENPLDPSMDVGAGAYRIQMIQRVFIHSFQTLLAYVAEPREPTDSILARIIPPTEEMEKRRLFKLSLGEVRADANRIDGRSDRWEGPKKMKSDSHHGSNGSTNKNDREGKSFSKKHKSDRWESPKKRQSNQSDSNNSRYDQEKNSSKNHKSHRRDSNGSQGSKRNKQHKR